MNAPAPVIEQALARYRPWLWAAAAYNLAWGTLVVLFPNLLFDLIGLRRPDTPALWQVVGMFVLVYAPAYAWAARRATRNWCSSACWASCWGRSGSSGPPTPARCRCRSDCCS